MSQLFVGTGKKKKKKKKKSRLPSETSIHCFRSVVCLVISGDFVFWFCFFENQK